VTLMMRRVALVGLLCVAVSACSSWFEESEKPGLPGKRIAVLSHDNKVDVDAQVKDLKVTLPKPAGDLDWPQQGGVAQHAMHHLALAQKPKEVWSSSVGEAADAGHRLQAEPVVADGKVFAMDASSHVSAFDRETGHRLWRVPAIPDDLDKEYAGGGLAYDDGKLIVSTAYAQVVALDPKSGDVLWRQNLPAPVRGAPTVRGGRVFVVTLENQTFALAASDGHRLWTHEGLAETASLMGASAPAVDGDIVVTCYSSGQVVALRVESGALLWEESLSSLRRTDAVSFLADIRGLPVIDHGRVYILGNSDRFSAIDLRTGRVLWDREIGGIQTPWLAGDFIFVVSNNAELLALEAHSGRVRWATQLPLWQDEKKKKDRIIWSGPVLAGDRLILAGSHGFATSVSPYTGEVLGTEELADPVSVPPVVAHNTLFLLTDEGDLVAYK